MTENYTNIRRPEDDGLTYRRAVKELENLKKMRDDLLANEKLPNINSAHELVAMLTDALWVANRRLKASTAMIEQLQSGAFDALNSFEKTMNIEGAKVLNEIHIIQHDRLLKRVKN